MDASVWTCERINQEALSIQTDIRKFLSTYSVYDLIPLSSKLVAFEKNLLVKKAFFALVQHGVRSAPVWDQSRQCFIGLVTITDFIEILIRYYNDPGSFSGNSSSSSICPDSLEPVKDATKPGAPRTAQELLASELEKHKIITWRQMRSLKDEMVSIPPDESICEAVRLLLTKRIHRLPVLDPLSGCALFVLTHKRILSFLKYNFFNFIKQPPCYRLENLREAAKRQSSPPMGAQHTQDAQDALDTGYSEPSSNSNGNGDSTPTMGPRQNQRPMYTLLACQLRNLMSCLGTYTYEAQLKAGLIDCLPNKARAPATGDANDANDASDADGADGADGAETSGVEDLGIFTATSDTKIIDVLKTFSAHRTSALPVVNKQTRRLESVFAKFDVINLAAERAYCNLDMKIGVLLSSPARRSRAASNTGPLWENNNPHSGLSASTGSGPQSDRGRSDSAPQGLDHIHLSTPVAHVSPLLHTCSLSNTLFEIIDKLFESRVHRLFVVSDDFRVEGVVSLSDVLKIITGAHLI